jgi:ATP synthase protein I
MLPAVRGRGVAMMVDPKPEVTSDKDQVPPPAREGDGWQILSYMLGGMALYGGIGWLVGKWTGISVLFPIGMILGIGLSVALIIFRFTRSGPGRQ